MQSYIIMLWIVSLIIGLAGFSAGSYWDLRYTEFPDWLPYSMIISALAARAVFSFLYSDFSLLANSVMVGCLFLGLGLVMYFLKQWGDGDAWLLGAMGFLFPDMTGFEVPVTFNLPLALLLNFLFVSLFYLICYSLLLGYRSRKLRKSFLREIRNDSKRYGFFVAVFFLGSYLSVMYLSITFGIPPASMPTMLMLPFLLSFILIFTSYARLIEKDMFKKRIPVSELREGDVVLDDKWRGLEKEEVEKIRKNRKFVCIKEGVRFAPVFLLTTIITFLIGDIILIIV